jgi:hypothetical protein
MQLFPQILNTVAFIGLPGECGFIALGTCFFVEFTQADLDFLYVVTCRHLVKTLDKSYIRVNRKNLPPVEIEFKKDDWISHSDNKVDISIAPWNKKEFDADDSLLVSPIGLKAALDKNIIQYAAMSIGDGLFMPSLFVGRVGDQKNIPVMRIANLAAMADEPVWGGSPMRPAYLIETRSLGGTSGSPVFLNVHPERIPGRTSNAPITKDDGSYSVPYLLIGIFQGIHSGQYKDDFVIDEAADRVLPQDVDFNAGIGIVLPVSQIIETIEQPSLSQPRLATIEKKHRQSGYRPA